MEKPTIRPEFPQVIDSTMRGNFTACPRQFYFGYVLGLSSPRLSIHLHFGACFAAGLEAFRREFYTDFGARHDPREQHARALNVGFRKIILEWGDYPPEDDDYKTLWSCLAALDFYFEHHGPATDPLLPYIKEDGTPAVEFSFTLPLDINHPETGEPLIYAGRFDMLGVMNDMFFVVDEKTTKALGASWSSSWTMRAQFKGYAYAARQHGFNVQGTIVRGVAIRKTGFDCADALVPTSNWDLDRWYTQLNRDVRRMLELWHEGYWDQNLDSTCSSYGGCSFVPLCSTDAEQAATIMEEEYRVRRWNPLLADPLRTKEDESLAGSLL